MRVITIFFVLALHFSFLGVNGSAHSAAVAIGDGGHLEYRSDEQGNRIPDFSHCGYQGTNRAIPTVVSQVFVDPSGNDDTKRLQAAIDFVSQQKAGPDGFRGAVLLGEGEFLISGQLRISTSGVVLRGHGAGRRGTTLKAIGRDRRPLILIRPPPSSCDNGPKTIRRYPIVDEVVTTGATRVQLSSTTELAVGQRVHVVHPSSTAWISKLGGDELGWREGAKDIRWERTIMRIDGDRIELDAPLTLAIDHRLTRAFVQRLDRSDRINQVGVEDLALVSAYDQRNPHDEDHAWFGIAMQSAQDAWVRRVRFRHFAGGAVILGHDTTRITVVDCAAMDPISEIGGYRRHTFFTQGQQCLFLRCWSEDGLHDFAVGHGAAGPNAFVHCHAQNALGDSGPLESCATGVLYDNVRIDGHDLNLVNRWNGPPKTGWAAINCVLWQCQAANVRCERPPTGCNWALGIWANPSGNGQFESLSEFIKPISLFRQQLKERVGPKAADRVGPFLLNPVGATNPSVEQAQDFTARSSKPARQLIDLIRDHWKNVVVPGRSVPRLEDIKSRFPSSSSSSSTESPIARPLEVNRGWLTANGKLMTGGHFTPMWWRGELQRERAERMGPAITRFAPGRYGRGLTDDLGEVADYMSTKRIVGYDHHYGLWYDRRRDDHLMVRRADGGVVPPFYEQPFARSGKGRAWDGLSRYDLSKFNPWYFHRLRTFADLGERHGFVLFHHHYFQHSILEAGAHWADSPWRPANNVNDTGLPEPPPYIGDKRIFLAERFYDVSNQQLRSLHRNYIRQCLNASAHQHNVIQLTSGEFTGPLSFVRFWLETIVQWEQDTGTNVLVGLSCTKDVQDAILDDPRYVPHVDVIDIRYWTYTADGQLYSPAGGMNLSPRQHLRRLKPDSTSFASIVRSVRQYRTRFPAKAVTYYANIYCRAQRDGWAILMGGGSLANVPDLPDDLAQAIVRMKPSDRLDLPQGRWCLAEGDREFLIYGPTKEKDPEKGAVKIRLPQGEYQWVRINTTTGEVEGRFAEVANRILDVDSGPDAIWVRSR